MQSATAYLVSDRVLIGSENKPTAGVWIAQGPIESIATDDLAALGNGLAAALDRSQEGVAHPSAWKGLFDPFIKAAGVSSLKQFMSGARCVGITRENEDLRLEPTRNLGAKDGFESMTGRHLTLASGDPCEMAKALLAAFHDSD